MKLLPSCWSLQPSIQISYFAKQYWKFASVSLFRSFVTFAFNALSNLVSWSSYLTLGNKNSHRVTGRMSMVGGPTWWCSILQIIFSQSRKGKLIDLVKHPGCTDLPQISSLFLIWFLCFAGFCFSIFLIAIRLVRWTVSWWMYVL